MCLSELLRKGGNLEQQELNQIALEVRNSNVNEQGIGDDIKIFDHIDVIKQSFNRWKNANLQKFKQLEEVENKDVEMILEKINRLQKNKVSSSERKPAASREPSPGIHYKSMRNDSLQNINTSVKGKDGSI